MNVTELDKRINDLANMSILKNDRVMVRNCVDGKMYDIDPEIVLAIRGNESIVIIDIQPDKEEKE